jgi:hypothetical protein
MSKVFSTTGPLEHILPPRTAQTLLQVPPRPHSQPESLRTSGVGETKRVCKPALLGTGLADNERAVQAPLAVRSARCSC